MHHYYHHRGKDQASTFWAGCGAVQRALFLQLGGFDAKRYRYPSIEDIELGYRIGDAGGTIVLERRLQGKHLKEWRFVNLVHTEVFRRALPWSRLMLERKDITDDLNVGKSERLRAALTGAVLLSVFALGGRVAEWLGVRSRCSPRWSLRMQASSHFLRARAARCSRCARFCFTSFTTSTAVRHLRRRWPGTISGA